MDPIQSLSVFDTVIELLKAFGLPGIILVIWYFDHRKIDAYRQIVRNDGRLLQDIHDALTLFIQSQARLEQKIDDNRFCPVLRAIQTDLGVFNLSFEKPPKQSAAVKG